MLKLDGAEQNLGGREFVYTIPAPFGPKRGVATLKIVAKPASSQNVKYRAAVEDLMHRARVMDYENDLQLEKDGNHDRFIATRERNLREVTRASSEIQYDACIVSWETTIQNAGSDMKPTKENYVELSQFAHPDIQKVFAKIRQDLQEYTNFTAESDNAEIEEEAKN